MDISGLARVRTGESRPRGNLQLSRTRIKQGNLHSALIFPHKPIVTEPSLQSIHANRPVLHRKSRSDIACKALRLTTRTLAVTRGQKVIQKAYLVPSKPVLFPFVERPGSSLRLSSLRSCPYSLCSLVSSPAETRGSRPVTSIHGVVSAGGLLRALQRSWSWSYLNGSRSYFFFFGLGASRCSACFLCSLSSRTLRSGSFR